MHKINLKWDVMKFYKKGRVFGLIHGEGNRMSLELTEPSGSGSNFILPGMPG